MNAFRFLLFILILSYFSIACNNQHATKVHLLIKNALHKRIVVQQVGYLDERSFIIDSFSNIDRDVINADFEIPLSEEKIFRIYSPDVLDLNLFFVNDSKKIDIIADFLDNAILAVRGSAATVELNRVIQKTDSIIHNKKNIESEIARDKILHLTDTHRDSLLSILKNNESDINYVYKQSADTTKSAGVFLWLFDKINFEDNRNALKSFVLNIDKRFPNHKIINQLKLETLNYISIFEKEYNIGDIIPTFSLPDNKGNMFSTASLKGKYYFIDIWSPLDKKSLLITKQKVIAYNIFPVDKFSIVSVSFDDDMENWKKSIGQYKWIQLIDGKMWKGTAVNTLKFDSIPFNYLVSPKGIIIDKAIKSNAIVTRIKEAIYK